MAVDVVDVADPWDRVERILASGAAIGMACTGGGSLLVSWLFNHPGASRALVEAQIPYHPAALADYLEAPGPHRVATSTAVQMASRAWQRAGSLVAGARSQACPATEAGSAPAARAGAGGAEAAAPAVGIGCTAALVTRRRRRGEDRAAIAVRTAGACRVCVLAWNRETATRQQQEQLLSAAGLTALGLGCGLPASWPAWPPGVHFEQRELSLADPVGLLCAGDVPCIECAADGTWSPDVRRPGRLLLSGSFDPLHAGHTGLLAAAEKLTGRVGAFELSVENVDKPELTRAQVERRAGQFGGMGALVCTRAPTFAAKARLFGDCTFVVGYDTAVRLVEPRYYGGLRQMELAFAQMATAGTRFLVAGRLADGQYRSLDDLEVPPGLPVRFAPIPPSAFRVDISSTELRRRAGTLPDP